MWTDLVTVKQFIQDNPIVKPNVINEPVVLEGVDQIQLNNSNILDDSWDVKIIRQAAPSADSHNPITLNSTTEVSLDNSFIVPDTVVVADDTLLSTVYVENDDYIIDYLNGTIARASTGTSIPNGGQVYVWYIPFVELTETTDYLFYPDTGKIARISTGSVPNNATVFVDYQTISSSPSDDAITKAIEFAEAHIKNKLKGSFDQSSMDTDLTSGATFLSLYILSLSQAFAILADARYSYSDDIAKQWFSLSSHFLTLAKSHLSRFINVQDLHGAGVIQNRFAGNRRRTVYSPTVTPRRRKR